MVSGYIIKQSARDHVTILSKSSKKTLKRSKKLKADDGTEHSLIEPIHIISM